MFSSPFLYLLFLGLTLFNTLQWVNAGRNCKCPGDAINDLDLGPLPPRPGEKGSQVPPDWKWETVLVDDICSDNPYIQNQAQILFQENTLYSILTGQENQARNEYEAKEQKHIRDKQIQYNENMKKQWKKDRMNTLPRKCIISRR